MLQCLEMQSTIATYMFAAIYGISVSGITRYINVIIEPESHAHTLTNP